MCKIFSFLNKIKFDNCDFFLCLFSQESLKPQPPRDRQPSSSGLTYSGFVVLSSTLGIWKCDHRRGSGDGGGRSKVTLSLGHKRETWARCEAARVEFVKRAWRNWRGSGPYFGVTVKYAIKVRIVINLHYLGYTHPKMTVILIPSYFPENLTTKIDKNLKVFSIIVELQYV